MSVWAQLVREISDEAIRIMSKGLACAEVCAGADRSHFLPTQRPDVTMFVLTEIKENLAQYGGSSFYS